MLISEKKFQDACERIRQRRDVATQIRKDMIERGPVYDQTYGIEQGLSQALDIMNDVIQYEFHLDPVMEAVLVKTVEEGQLKQVRDLFDKLENEQ